MSVWNRTSGRLLQVALLIFSGWLGEWSFFVSWARSIYDWFWTGVPNAHPRLIVPPDWVNLPYGLSWRVALYRGGPFDPLGILSENGFGLAVLFGVFLIFYEFLKVRTCSRNVP
jgi:hypothetical protein